MFTTKYRPKKIADFIGNSHINKPFIEWLVEWDENKNKCALISGLCGIGKNLFVDLILHKFNYNGINLSLDTERNKDYMNNIIKPLLGTKKTLDGKNNVLIVSDIDCGNDHGFISTLLECIKNTSIPIICICDNRYDQSIKPIIQYCLDLKMLKPTYQEVYGLMYKIIKTEKMNVTEKEIKELYEQSNGDIRFMLNTLQFGLVSGLKNIQSTNIFDTTAKLLSIDETIDSKYDTYWLYNDLHPLIIQENYIDNIMASRYEVKRLENLDYVAETLSDLDMFDTYVNMTNWEFDPYVALSAINASSKCNKRSMIKFPQFLGRISTMNKNKREKLNYEDVVFFKREKETKPKKEKETKPKKEKETKPKKEKETKPKKEKETKPKKEKETKSKREKETKPKKEN